MMNEMYPVKGNFDNKPLITKHTGHHNTLLNLSFRFRYTDPTFIVCLRRKEGAIVTT